MVLLPSQTASLRGQDGYKIPAPPSSTTETSSNAIAVPDGQSKPRCAFFTHFHSCWALLMHLQVPLARPSPPKMHPQQYLVLTSSNLPTVMYVPSFQMGSTPAYLDTLPCAHSGQRSLLREPGHQWTERLPSNGPQLHPVPRCVIQTHRHCPGAPGSLQDRIHACYQTDMACQEISGSRRSVPKYHYKSQSVYQHRYEHYQYEQPFFSTRDDAGQQASRSGL